MRHHLIKISTRPESLRWGVPILLIFKANGGVCSLLTCFYRNLQESGNTSLEANNEEESKTQLLWVKSLEQTCQGLQMFPLSIPHLYDFVCVAPTPTSSPQSVVPPMSLDEPEDGCVDSSLHHIQVYLSTSERQGLICPHLT